MISKTFQVIKETVKWAKEVGKEVLLSMPSATLKKVSRSKYFFTQ
jgi:hypothetical protein